MHHHVDTAPPSTSSELQTQIESLTSIPLDEAVKCMSQLLPTLTTSISPTGTRLVTHPTHSGTGKLDDLGRLYLRAADRCTREHASFKIRLLHVTLDSMMEKLYVSSEGQLRKGVEDGTVKLQPPENKGCPCCMGEPYAVILAGFHEQEAFLFLEDEYRAIWGDEESQGGQYSVGESWLKASREQVERAMAKEEAGRVGPSML